MGLTRILLPDLILRPAKRLYVARKYNAHLCRGVSVSRRTVLEGRSLIGKDSDISDSMIGLGTYVAAGSRLTSTRVGRYCSIGRQVSAGAGMHPASAFVSTHPSFFSPKKQAGFAFADTCLFEEHAFIAEASFNGTTYKYSVDIGNDVWLGDHVKVLDGVAIGDGAIVGLGSIVTRDLEPYSINVGNPARAIRYRFTQSQIEFLLDFKWWERPFDWIRDNSRYFGDIAAFVDRFSGDGLDI
jgi:acetyltransferase-like isoleucine patch superfamily enzyme